MEVWILKCDMEGMKAGTELEASRITKMFVEVTSPAGKRIMLPKSKLSLKAEMKTASEVMGIGSTETTVYMDDVVGEAPSAKESRSLDELLGSTASSFDGADAAEEREAKRVAVTKAKPIKKADIPEDELSLATLTNGRLPTKTHKDHLFKVFGPDYWDAGVRDRIPEVDESYYWDANVLEKIIIAYKRGKSLLLVGYPGTGKTTAFQQFAAWIKMPVFMFSGKADMEGSSLMGNMWANAATGGMEFKDGIVPEAAITGGMMLGDEIWKIHPDTMMNMQSLMAGGNLLVDDRPEKTIVPADTLFQCFTDNCRGVGDEMEKFGSTQMQDTSTLDRVDAVCEVKYLDSRQEQAMLKKKYPTADPEMIRKLTKLAKLIRNAYTKGEVALTLSPRGLQTALDMLDDFDDLALCLDCVYLDKLGDETERDAVREMVRTVGF